MRVRALRGIWLVGLMLAMLSAFAAENKDRIAFQIGSAINNNIRVMFTDYSRFQDLPPHSDAPGVRVTPALSSDGYTLAFSAKVRNRYKIFTWPLDDQNKVIGAPHQLTPDDPCDDKFPAWSLDGKQLTYLATDDYKKTHLRVINSDGSGMKDLADAWFAPPAWSPDGQFILFVGLDGKKPVLRSIASTGGTVITFGKVGQPIAACYSPDGTQIAALIRHTDTLADLWLFMPPVGAGAKMIVPNIADCKAISWPKPEQIIFNASKVNGQKDHSFWSVSPKGGAITGISSLNDPKHTSFFSVQRSVANADIPSVITSGVLGPDGNSTGVGERTNLGTVTVIRPLAGEVRGVVQIKVLAKKEVTTVVLRLKSQNFDQFLYAGAVQSNGETGPQMTYTWDTQELALMDPRKDRVLPSRYQSALRYPDDDYIVTALGLDAEGHQVGEKDSIKVIVKNSLPDTSLPGNLYLHYQYHETEPETDFSVHGEGMPYGVDPQAQGSLFATLDARIHHALIEQRTDGRYDIRTELRTGTDPYPLQFGLFEAAIPESPSVSALYAVSPNGMLEVVAQQREKIELPLAKLFVPFPTETEQRDQMTAGHQWSADMWVVADLLERKAILVPKAQHTLEGMEWIGNQHAIRIRSQYQLDPAMSALALTPITYPPRLKTTDPPVPGLAVTAANGVRYTWFDSNRNRIIRVEDMVIYEFSLDAPPPVAPTAAPAGGPGGAPSPNPAAPGVGMGGDQPAATTPPVIAPFKRGAGTGYYVVRYSYNLINNEESNENK